MEDYSWLGSLLTASPDMNTGDITAFMRLSRRNDLRILRMSTLKVLHELQVILVLVVRLEPSIVGAAICENST